MLGMLFFFIAICAWIAKWSNDHDQNYTEYKKKGSDNYGCWRDGYNGWHWGNKILTTFFIHGHRVLAVPDLLSCRNYDYTRYKYVVRDLTLEEEIRKEIGEVVAFKTDMATRQKAIEEGKKYYKSTLEKSKGDRTLYRRVDNNRLYKLAWCTSTCLGLSYLIKMQYYVVDLVSSKVDRNNQIIYALVEKEGELVATLHSAEEKTNYKEWGKLSYIEQW